MTGRRDTPHRERRGAPRRHADRRRDSAPVLMDTRTPGERRAGERRERASGDAPDETPSGNGGGDDHR